MLDKNIKTNINTYYIHIKMEFQSYTLYYTYETQKNEILQTIKQHNEYVKENNLEHGELFHILHAKLKQKLFNIPISDSRYCIFSLYMYIR